MPGQKSWYAGASLLLSVLSLLPGGQAESFHPYAYGPATANLDNTTLAGLQNANGLYTIDLTSFGDQQGINFLDNRYTELHVSINGVVEFGGGGGASSESNPSLPVEDISYGPYIAVLWEEAAAPSSTSDSEVRVYISDSVTDPTDSIGLRGSDGNRLTGLLKDYFHNIAQDYTNTSLAIMISWVNMYPNGGNTVKNSFQLVIFTDGCQTYILLNYVTIGWTSLPADSGRKPRAAISGGDGMSFLEMPDSETAAIFQLASESNVNDAARQNGWFWLRVDRAAVMELIPAACVDNKFGTLGTYGCICSQTPSTKGAIDCTDGIYSDMCWTVPLSECPTPCGGCGSVTVENYCDKCAGVLSTATSDCNVSKCEKGTHSPTEIVYKNGRRIQRNRKCCYKFSKTPPVKFSPTRFPDGKSCCRPRVKGWSSGSGSDPLPSC